MYVQFVSMGVIYTRIYIHYISYDAFENGIRRQKKGSLSNIFYD